MDIKEQVEEILKGEMNLKFMSFDSVNNCIYLKDRTLNYTVWNNKVSHFIGDHETYRIVTGIEEYSTGGTYRHLIPQLAALLPSPLTCEELDLANAFLSEMVSELHHLKSATESFIPESQHKEAIEGLMKELSGADSMKESYALQVENLTAEKRRLQERIIDKACERLLSNSYFSYEDGHDYEYIGDSPFCKEIDKRIKTAIDAKFNEITENHLLPLITEKLQNLVIEQTNQYGEKKGESLTLVEYLVEKAEDYMLQEVDYNGKPKGERSSCFRFDPEKTLLAHQVHKYLHNHIEKAMKEVVGSANKTIADSLAETCKIQLTNISKNLKVAVTTK